MLTNNSHVTSSSQCIRSHSIKRIHTGFWFNCRFKDVRSKGVRAPFVCRFLYTLE